MCQSLKHIGEEMFVKTLAGLRHEFLAAFVATNRDFSRMKDIRRGHTSSISAHACAAYFANSAGCRAYLANSFAGVLAWKRRNRWICPVFLTCDMRILSPHSSQAKPQGRWKGALRQRKSVCVCVCAGGWKVGLLSQEDYIVGILCCCSLFMKRLLGWVFMLAEAQMMQDLVQPQVRLHYYLPTHQWTHFF